MPVDALEVILLDAGDAFGNEIGHDAIDRAAIISAAPQDGLERRDIGGIAEQLVARLEVIIKAGTGSRKIIGLIHVRHLMEPAPVITRRERIDGMEKRIVIRSANTNCGEGGGEKHESDTAKAVGCHKNKENLITTLCR